MRRVVKTIFLMLIFICVTAQPAKASQEDVKERLVVYASRAYLINQDGTVTAWGNNENGALGDGTTELRVKPQQVKNLSNIVKIVASGYHIMALDTDGNVWAWGGNSDLYEPNKVAKLPPAVDIAHNKLGTIFAVSEDGQVYTWKSEIGSTPSVIEGLQNIVAVNGEVAVDQDGKVWSLEDIPKEYKIAADPLFIGNDFLITRDHRMFVWSSSFPFYLGYDLREQVYNQGYIIPYIDHIEKFLTGNGTYFVLKQDGTIWSWGDSIDGMLGLGTIEEAEYPKQVEIPVGIVDFAVSNRTVAAVDESGNVWVWGGNQNNRLGTPEPDKVYKYDTPQKMENFSDILQVYGGTNFFAFVDTTGEIWTLGENDNAQLGVGSTDPVTVPTKVNGVHFPLEGVEIGPLTITIDGEMITFDSPLMVSSDILVEAGALAEIIQADWIYQEDTQTGSIHKGSKEVLLKVNEPYIIANGAEKYIPVGLSVVGEAVYIPLQAVLDHLFYDTSWSKASNEFIAVEKIPLQYRQPIEEVQAIDGRLVLQLPGGFTPILSFNNDAKNMNQSKFLFKDGPEEYTVVVDELFQFSTGDIQKDMALLTELWAVDGERYKVVEYQTKNGLQVGYYLPDSYDAGEEAIVKGAVMVHPDGTLIQAYLTVNAAASYDYDYCLAFADSIFYTIASGERALLLSTQEGLLSGGYSIQIPENFIFQSTSSLRFLYEFTKVVPVGQKPVTLYISGDYRNSLRSKNDQTGTFQDMALGKSITWQYTKTADGTIDFSKIVETIINPMEVDYDFHVYVVPLSQGILDELLDMVRTIQYQPVQQ